MKLAHFMVAEQSHTMLEGLGSDSVRLLLAVEAKLIEIAAPNITWREESIDPGLLRALTGKRRDALLIEHSKRLREHRVLIVPSRRGTALQVSWLLIVSPRLASDLSRVVRLGADPETKYDLGQELDPIDAIDLNGFIGVARLAFEAGLHSLRERAEADTDDEPLFIDSE